MRAGFWLLHANFHCSVLQASSLQFRLLETDSF